MANDVRTQTNNITNYNITPYHNNNSFMNSFKIFCNGFVIIFLCLALYRTIYSGGTLSLENILDYLSNHFSFFSDLFSKLDMPSWRITSDKVPLIFEGFVWFWNNLVTIVNVIGYLVSLIANCVYTVISILLWVLTGVTI